MSDRRRNYQEWVNKAPPGDPEPTYQEWVGHEPGSAKLAGVGGKEVGIPLAGWRAPQVGLGVLAAAGAVFFGTLIVAIFDPTFDTTAGKDLAQLAVALGLGGTALGFALADADDLRGAVQRLGLTSFAWKALGIAAIGWLTYVIAAGLFAPLLQPDQQDVTRELGSEGETGVGLIGAGLLIVVAAPLTEEMFFRGFMFAGLRRSLPFLPAAAISAAVWGSLHLGAGNVGVAIQLALFGVVLAWIYERTGSLWAPVAAHMLNNAIAFAVLVSDLKL